MSKEFKLLRGNRVFLEMPKKELTVIEVSENTRKALDEEFSKRMTRAKVYAVGNLVSDIQEGDIIMMDPAALQRAPVIELSPERTVLLVSPFDIIHIW